MVGTLFCTVPAFSASSFEFKKIDLQLLHLTETVDQSFASDGSVYEDTATTQYVESVGRSLLPPGPPPEHVKWKFRVLRNPEPNAFALANGSVYINTGLLSLLQNESQLAGLLAHQEIHVLKRHDYLEWRKAFKKGLISTIVLLAGVGVETGMGPIGIIPMLGGLYGPGMTGGNYNRELEREADLSAIKAMEKAGYQPEGLVEALRLLKQSAGQGHSQVSYRDSAQLETRIQYLEETIKANPPGPSPLRVGAEDYDRATKAVCLHDFKLEIMEGYPRRAVAIAHHLIEDHPTSENYRLLGDACRAMGGRLPHPSAKQIFAERKHAAKVL